MPAPSPAGAGIVRLARRNFAYLAAFTMDLTLASGTMAFTYMAKKRFEASPSDLGLFALVAAGAYVLSSLVFGRLSDRWGRRRSIVLACLVGSGVFLVGPCATRLWHLYALIVVFSVGQGAFWPALEADISDNSTPRELPVRLGRFNVAWCSGFAVASLGAGSLGQSVGWPTVLRAAAVTALLALAIYLLRTFEPEKLPERQPDERATQRARLRAGAFWRIALILNFAAMGLNGSMRWHMPTVTGGERGALGGSFLGALFAAELLTFFVLSRWHGWHYRSAPLAVGGAAALAGGLLCGLSPAPAVFGTGCALAGIGCGAIYYSSLYYSQAVETGRGHRGGIHESVLGLGAAVIPYLGGLLAVVPWAGDRLDWPTGTPFLTAAAVLAVALMVAALIYFRVGRPPGRRPATDPNQP